MSRSGFTLIEALVALLLAGMIAGIAAGVFVTSTDAVRRLDSDVVRYDRVANARAWLRDAFAGAEVATSPEATFSGSSTDLAFATRLWVAEGWLERSRIHLAAIDGRLIAQASGSGDVHLLDSVTALRIDYLTQNGARAPWLSQWESQITLPLAVRLRLARPRHKADTLLFLLGAPQ